MLELPLAAGLPANIVDFNPETLAARPIALGPHCFGCTAGSGSSCGGALEVESRESRVKSLGSRV
jgi:hypothetical protein